MLKPPISDLLQHADCRYSLVIVASKRTRQLMHGNKPLIDSQFEKPIVTALNEIHQSKVSMIVDPEDF